MTSHATRRASRPELGTLAALLAALWACGPRAARTGDAGGGGDGGADLGGGPEPRDEWRGIRWRGGRFTVCADDGTVEREVQVEIPQDVDPTVKNPYQCHGVFQRYRGSLEETPEGPVLHVTEVLEARWCRPGDCSDLACEPDRTSCFDEREISPEFQCNPVDPNDPAYQRGYGCGPVPFYATEAWGWMGYIQTERGSVVDDTCHYFSSSLFPAAGDDCAPGTRCIVWEYDRPVAGATGGCVPYCDPAGVVGEPCDGVCIPCGDLQWGLCISQEAYTCWQDGTCPLGDPAGAC